MSKTAVATAVLGALALAAPFSSPAVAATGRAHADAVSQAGSPQGDRLFVQKAAEAGMAEVEQAKTALHVTADPAVKHFAQRMIDDHTAANDKLRRIAERDHMQVPDKLDKQARQEMDRLDKLAGQDFDDAYMKHQVEAHQKAIAEFEKEAKSGRDEDFRRFADDTLPTLREHLKLAQTTDSAMHSASAHQGHRHTASDDQGLKAAKVATGREYAAVERAERMPVPKTGM